MSAMDQIASWIATNYPDLKPAPQCPVCGQTGKLLWVETHSGRYGIDVRLSGPDAVPVQPGKVECQTAECPAYRVEIRQ